MATNKSELRWMAAFMVIVCAVFTAIMYLGFSGYPSRAAAILLGPIAVVSGVVWWKLRQDGRRRL